MLGRCVGATTADDVVPPQGAGGSLEPHGAEADFREALFGFDKGELKRMILEDKLDQTATVIFDKVERNSPVSAAEVSFTPPKGADVIGTPGK